MSDEVGEIKARLDIADVIGDYVQLRRSGNTLWGLCPFHKEKSPSFSVSQERGSFHCFGCNKGGDVFTFIMEMEGVTFREALETLASRAGVTIKRGPREQKKASVDQRALLDEACSFFRRSFAGRGGEAARAYLKRRELSEEIASRFDLGWSPPAWNSLVEHFASHGLRGEDLVAVGLASPGQRGAYDRFRGRLMFPVRDEMGRIVGFGGRLIDGEGAKYVNSPESDLFNKRKLLYLMHEAKRSAREKQRVILMEGYMDVIRAHISGFTEAVASLGTALTEEQALLIKRFADLCYIAYDADAAGQEAALRGMYILQGKGVDVRVIVLPQGQDPDDVLRGEGGAQIFERLMEQALPLPLYHARMRRAEMARPESARRARDDVLSGLASLPFLDLSPHIAAIAEQFGILPHELQREIEGVRRAKEVRERTAKIKSAKPDEGISSAESVYIDEAEKPPDLECLFCSLLWHNAELRAKVPVRDFAPLFSDRAAASVVSALLAGESPGELENRWRAMGEDDCLTRLARGDAVLAREGLNEQDLSDEQVERLQRELRVQAGRRRYKELRSLYIRGDISEEERKEYAELTRDLKGRGERS